MKIGDTVYIQGLYRAKILRMSDGLAHCHVYEGLPAYPNTRRYTYRINLLTARKRTRV